MPETPLYRSVALVVTLMLEGVGISLPHWCVLAPLAVATAYRLKSDAESALNALPASNSAIQAVYHGQ